MTDQPTDNTPSAFEFPCSFPIKIVGLANDTFELGVMTIIKKHFPNLAEDSLKQKPSGEGKYLAITVTVLAENKKQLDDLYQDLSSCPDVIMAL
jgi:uncharacterized protein